ncbi:unnamed protein product [Durusdinium trenchii]|uniref:Uncharacterized protein n=1 Tax=Durusdinium trenchii TaxID=1381693 RepID=A0ABP0IT18_9DINO
MEVTECDIECRGVLRVRLAGKGMAELVVSSDDSPEDLVVAFMSKHGMTSDAQVQLALERAVSKTVIRLLRTSAMFHKQAATSKQQQGAVASPAPVRQTRAQHTTRKGPARMKEKPCLTISTEPDEIDGGDKSSNDAESSSSATSSSDDLVLTDSETASASTRPPVAVASSHIATTHHQEQEEEESKDAELKQQEFGDAYLLFKAAPTSGEATNSSGSKNPKANSVSSPMGKALLIRKAHQQKHQHPKVHDVIVGDDEASPKNAVATVGCSDAKARESFRNYMEAVEAMSSPRRNNDPFGPTPVPDIIKQIFELRFAAPSRFPRRLATTGGQTRFKGVAGAAVAMRWPWGGAAVAVWAAYSSLLCRPAAGSLVLHDERELVSTIVPVSLDFAPVKARSNVSVQVMNKAAYEAFCDAAVDARLHEVAAVYDADIVLVPMADIADLTCKGRRGSWRQPLYYEDWCRVSEFITISPDTLHPGLYVNARSNVDFVSCNISSGWLGADFDLAQLQLLSEHPEQRLYGRISPDENDALRLLNLWPVQVWFRVFTPLAHFVIVFLAVQGIRERRALQKLNNVHRYVLEVNAVSMLVLGVVHVFGHHYVANELPIRATVLFYSNLFQWGVGCDYALAVLYSDVVNAASSKRSRWRAAALWVAWIFPATTFSAALIILLLDQNRLFDLSSEFLGIIYFFLQFGICWHLYFKTSRVINMLQASEKQHSVTQSRATTTDSSEPVDRGKLLRRSLTYWVRVSVASSAMTLLCIVVITFEQNTQSALRWVLFWAVFDTCRVLNALAQVKATEIPKVVKQAKWWPLSAASRVRSTRVAPKRQDETESKILGTDFETQK